MLVIVHVSLVVTVSGNLNAYQQVSPKEHDLIIMDEYSSYVS